MVKSTELGSGLDMGVNRGKDRGGILNERHPLEKQYLKRSVSGAERQQNGIWDILSLKCP